MAKKSGGEKAKGVTLLAPSNTSSMSVSPGDGPSMVFMVVDGKILVPEDQVDAIPMLVAGGCLQMPDLPEVTE